MPTLPRSLPQSLLSALLYSLLCWGSQSALAANTAPAPTEFLGFATGQWHVRHDQVEAYFRTLAQSAPTTTRLEVIGRTHEQRPLLQLVIASEQNLAKLEQIRQQHLAVARGEAEYDPSLPLVIWLGYGVHGNESSGPNAALEVAYELVAAKTAEAKQTLDNAIILLQPSLNPDGMDRFALWANMHQGTSPVADTQHREHIEPWPNVAPIIIGSISTEIGCRYSTPKAALGSPSFSAGYRRSLPIFMKWAPMGHTFSNRGSRVAIIRKLRAKLLN